MDDTISREKAINMIVGTASKVWDLDIIDTPKNLLLTGAAARQDEIIDILKNIPSAQPEETCDTCKHGSFGDRRCDNCRVGYPSHYERRTDERMDV